MLHKKIDFQAATSNFKGVAEIKRIEEERSIMFFHEDAYKIKLLKTKTTIMTTTTKRRSYALKQICLIIDVIGREERSLF